MIGIDIDNKEDTLERYNQICQEKGHDKVTLTTRTMHEGFHYDYRLTDEQKEGLADFKSVDGKMFGLHIDVKYTNQFLFGPSVMVVEGKIYTYKVIKDVEPAILPDFLYQEILIQKKNYNDAKKKGKKTTKQAGNGGETSPIHAEKEGTKPTQKSERLKKEDQTQIDQRLTLWLDCLYPFRFDEQPEWFRIGGIIRNEGGSRELFHTYSRRSIKYNIKDVDAQWEKYNQACENPATILSLIEMAKVDCFDEDNWNQENVDKFHHALIHDRKTILDLLYSNGISDTVGAYMYYCLCPTGYIFDGVNNLWYKLNKWGIYVTDNTVTLLKNDINKIVLPSLEREFFRRSQNKSDEEKTKLAKIYCDMRKYVSKSKNKDEMIKELKLLYNDMEVQERFDNVNNYVIAFKNGVFDLKERGFRPAKPEELITCTTGYNYVKASKEKIDELVRILTTIMPDMEERTYLLKHIAQGLVGDKMLEQFYIWIGTGRNGKGLIRDLIALALGKYYGSMEIDYLCHSESKNHHSNQADPIMASKKNTRIVITTEPEGDVKLKCNKISQIAGQDPVTARHLNKEPITFTPKFQLIIQTNKEPIVEGFDPALKMKLRFIKFPTVFVDNPSKPNEKKIDRTLKAKFKNDEGYKIAFFQILLDHYFDFVDHDENKLDMPPRFKQETDDYLNENDPVSRFLDGSIEVTRDTKDKIKASELYQSFLGTLEKKFNFGERNFKNALVGKDIQSHRFNTGIFYIGIKWKKQEERAAEVVNLFGQDGGRQEEPAEKMPECLSLGDYD